MAVNIKKAMGDPIARDVGNRVTQGRWVPRTMQFGMFTTNENAVWASNQQLQKESYPFATIAIPVNRDQFRLEVGDVFKFNYAKYGITGMICRVLLVEESDLQSEKIVLHVMEDIFSVAKAITEYTDPEDSEGTPPDYDFETLGPFTIYDCFEAPYALSDIVRVIPLAGRIAPTDSGMVIYLSLDNGVSYLKLDSKSNIMPYGTLVEAYGETNPIDTDEGILIDFPTTDVTSIESQTLAETLSGNNNMGILGDEIISFQNITPVSGTQYRLENVIRGRYGTQQDSYIIGARFWFVNKGVGMVNHSEIVGGVNRDFKLVPYNIKYAGDLADAAQIDLDLLGKCLTPYLPINFNGNGASFASRYTTDIVLTWNCRKRGEGAGVGAPGIVLANTDYEGLCDIEVWVSSVLVRTEVGISTLTWTYTSGMNTTDNGTLATEVLFKLTNYREDDGITYTSDEALLYTKLAL